MTYEDGAIFTLRHDPRHYFVASLKLWVLKLKARIFMQRRSLTLVLILFALSTLLLNHLIFLAFLSVLISIIAIDLLISLRSARVEVRKTREYLLSNGRNINIYAGRYFCFIEEGIEYKKAQWSEIHEYCQISNPNFFSFKNRNTKEVLIIFENEVCDQRYMELKNIIESKIQVLPLIQ